MSTTNSHIMRSAREAWTIHASFWFVARGSDVAVGAGVRRAVPFDVSMEAASITFVAGEFGSGLVG